MKFKMVFIALLFHFFAISAKKQLLMKKYPVPFSVIIADQHNFFFDGFPYTVDSRELTYIKYAIFHATHVVRIKILLGDKGCKNIDNIKVLFLKKSTPKNFQLLFNGKCGKLLNSEDDKIDIKLKNNGFYGKYLHIEIEPNKVIKDDLAVIKDIKMFTPDSITQKKGSKGLEHSKDQYEEVFDGENAEVAKIVLSMSDNFDFGKKHTPEMFFDRTHSTKARFKKNYLKNSLEAVFPNGVNVNEMTLRNKQFVEKINLYAPGQHVMVGKTANGEVSFGEEAKAVTQIHFPDSASRSSLLYALKIDYSRKNGKTRSVYVEADTSTLNLYFRAKNVKVSCWPEDVKCDYFRKFIVLTTPCDKKKCKNGSCSYDYSEINGFGCSCKKPFAGPLCAKKQRFSCSNMSAKLAKSEAELVGNDFVEGEVMPYFCDGKKRKGNVRCRDGSFFSLPKGKAIEASDLCN